MFRTGLILLLSLFPVVSWAFSVTFINPGHADEPYWRDAAQGMRAVASSLGIELEILYANRDLIQQIELTEAVTLRPKDLRPDYLLFSVEKRTFAAQMKLADAADIPVFLAFSGLRPEERELYGAPRKKLPRLLGSLTPRAEDAGYLTAQTLIEAGWKKGLAASDGKIHMLALSGDRSTDTSVRRNEGLMQAIDEAGDVVLDQMVHADWRRDVAEFKARQLYVRYPEARLVWSGSDLIAFGAMDALRSRKPGEDVLFSGINSSAAAMNSLIDGRLTALAGGHFMAGGWSLVLLYDYHHGRDFAEEGVELERPMFTLFDSSKARQYLERFGNGVPNMDFSRFSKILNPSLKRYNFEFGQLLEP
ncbi:ABC transporter substrate-binding protein [Marinobacter nanhaiticus D15-8W]|uniref:Sugar ABC transporter substrate-binding protein n=1 Tax=Marinobacter nanhaiticus D15-8W TaxID=626887 RepID=N6W1P8_9GAMM|nr:ABC transporter substrate-binding protein [Marinobacter nanhaiticus]ENO16450.1 sugar ABC transporter substrate-binding protein [Marinobacter nanhaiticus D15-8W]BES72237.1 ABC transporter substrate-binding protein [Marinobacter nanhaiticus D15-8W]